MEASTPVIFTPPHIRQQVGVQGRLLALFIALACLGVLITAALIKPSPDGVGTHQQMGFRGCDFLDRTHLPCPSCGMTTSFAWFARGNWLASFYVQPMGFVLALTAGAMFWACALVAATGAPLHTMTRHLPMVYVVCGAVGFGIAAWGWKIFIHLQHLDGWGK